jgi:NAD(P)H-nitrite reductase large subunit
VERKIGGEPRQKETKSSEVQTKQGRATEQSKWWQAEVVSMCAGNEKVCGCVGVCRSFLCLGVCVKGTPES